MGAVLGLLAGCGLVLIGSAFLAPRPTTRTPGPDLGGLLVRAGVPRNGAVPVLVGAALAAVSAGLIVFVISATVPVALVFAVLAGRLPFGVLQARARRRQREFAEVWPEAVDNLASGVRAGLSLAEALGALGTRGPEPLRPAFVAFALDHQVSGRFGEALDRLKEGLADPVGDRVTEALRVAREVGGGDLGRLLRNLSWFLREDARTRAELEARQAWAVNGARLAVAAPWLVLFLLCFQRDVIGRYASGAGVVVLVGGAAACVTAYAAMLRIGRLPTDRRILR